MKTEEKSNTIWMTQTNISKIFIFADKIKSAKVNPSRKAYQEKQNHHWQHSIINTRSNEFTLKS